MGPITDFFIHIEGEKNNKRVHLNSIDLADFLPESEYEKDSESNRNYNRDDDSRSDGE